jgi:hypothetical protein
MVTAGCTDGSGGERDGAVAGLRPGSNSSGLGTMKGARCCPARMRSSGSVRQVTAARLDSHGGEACSEELFIEELDVAMAERRLRHASSGGRKRLLQGAASWRSWDGKARGDWDQLDSDEAWRWR